MPRPRSQSASLTLAGVVALAGSWGLALRWEARSVGDGSSGGGEALPLAAGARVEARLEAGQVHAFAFHLAAGHFAQLVVEQRGVDVATALFDPAGRLLLAVDSPTGALGPEQVFAVARAAGTHRFEVRPLRPADSGRYELTLAVPRRATAADRLRAAAAAAVVAGERRRSRGEGEALLEALARYEEALALWARVGEALQQSNTHRRLAQIHFRLGEVRAALGQFREADLLLTRLDRRDLAAGLLNETGAALRLAGQTPEAERSFIAALGAARASGDLREEVVALNNLALLHKSAGRPWRALAHYHRALALWQELADPAGEAVTWHNIGVLYTLLGKLPEALDTLGRALALRRAAGQRAGEAATLTALGWAHLWSGEAGQAIEELNQALALRRQAGDRRGQGVTLDRLGTARSRLGQNEEARRCYEEALAIFRAAGDAVSEAHTLNNLGALQALAGRPEEALACHRRALALFQEVEDAAGEAHAQYRIALAERQGGRLAAARAAAAEALRLAEGLRTAAQSQALRSSYFASVQEYYELAIEVLVESHEREPGRGFDALALATVERARARSLLETLAAGEAAADEPGEAALAARQQELAARIAALERQRMAGALDGESEEQAALKAEVRRLLLAHDRVATEVRAAASSTLAAAPLTAPEIERRVLEPQTLLLAYSLGEERSFLFALDRQRLRVLPLPGRAEIEGLAIRLHGLLAESPGRGSATQAGLTAAALSEMLLGPVADSLAGRRLLVVPDGALHYVPFAALPVGRSVAPLVAEHEIIILPSASVLAAVRDRQAKRPAPGRGLAIFADPVFEPDDPRLARHRPAHPPAGARPILRAGAGRAACDGERGAIGEGFRRLPHSRREAEAILALVPRLEAHPAFGFAARRQAVTDGALDRYRILHFATHGLLHPRHPELSGIALSLLDEQGNPEDGFLRNLDISRLRLAADLVVVSGCRTALGQEMPGEGLVGLTQAFLGAGASRVLVSLWNVNDEATAVLIGRFYRSLLRDGLPPAAALRAAQLATRGEPRWQAPYYWAGFVLEGEYR